MIMCPTATLSPKNIIFCEFYCYLKSSFCSRTMDLRFKWKLLKYVDESIFCDITVEIKWY